MRVVATYSIKGGVGKTSAAVNLGTLGARDGLRTLIWDLDPQGAASYLLRIKPKVKGGGRRLIRGKGDPLDVMKGTDVEGLDLLPADFSYRHLDIELDKRKQPLQRLSKVLGALDGDYDLAILDCAPSISLVSESVFSAADLLLVPIVPSTLSVRTFEQLQGFLAETRRPPRRCSGSSRWSIGARSCTASSRSRCRPTLPAVSDTVIPSASIVELMGVRRAPVVATLPSSPAAKAYVALWERVRDTLDALPDRR